MPIKWRSVYIPEELHSELKRLSELHNTPMWNIIFILLSEKGEAINEI